VVCVAVGLLETRGAEAGTDTGVDIRRTGTEGYDVNDADDGRDGDGPRPPTTMGKEGLVAPSTRHIASPESELESAHVAPSRGSSRMSAQLPDESVVP